MLWQLNWWGVGMMGGFSWRNTTKLTNKSGARKISDCVPSKMRMILPLKALRTMLNNSVTRLASFRTKKSREGIWNRRNVYKGHATYNSNSKSANDASSGSFPGRGPMTLMIRNLKGLNSPLKQEEVKPIVSVFSLLETKIKARNKYLVVETSFEWESFFNSDPYQPDQADPIWLFWKREQ